MHAIDPSIDLDVILLETVLILSGVEARLVKSGTVFGQLKQIARSTMRSKRGDLIESAQNFEFFAQEKDLDSDSAQNRAFSKWMFTEQCENTFRPS